MSANALATKTTNPFSIDPLQLCEELNSTQSKVTSCYIASWWHNRGLSAWLPRVCEQCVFSVVCSTLAGSSIGLNGLLQMPGVVGAGSGCGDYRLRGRL
jgi:hypothetical protein